MPGKLKKARPIAWAERRAQTRERLLTAARETIVAKGFHRASLDEIAARAGVTKGAIYDNFASKDDLFLAVVAVWVTERSSRFAWPKGHSGSLRTRLRRFAAAVIADAPAAQLEAPMRAEFLLYTLTHEELRHSVARAAGLRLKQLRQQVLQFISEDELALPLDSFIVLFEALIPGLMFIRSQDPTIVTDDVIGDIFESLAGRSAKGS